MAFCSKCGAKLDDGASFCTKCGTQVQNPDTIPTFAPPAEVAPIFVPPCPPTQYYNGPLCYHHPNEPAAAQCARCGKYICKDCAEAYTVGIGQYANQCLCYDCCQALVEENISTLRKQKTKIITTFVFTIIGLIVGFALGIGANIGVAIIAALWCGSIWVVLKSAFGGYSATGFTLPGLIGGLIAGLLIGPIKTIIKIIQCLVYMRRTSNVIRDDTNALQQMTDYMEYTQVMSSNQGVDLEKLMGQGNPLYNNAYAHMVNTQGEAAADEVLRQCTTTIAENGEIIRNFAA